MTTVLVAIYSEATLELQSVFPSYLGGQCLPRGFNRIRNSEKLSSMRAGPAEAVSLWRVPPFLMPLGCGSQELLSLALELSSLWPGVRRNVCRVSRKMSLCPVDHFGSEILEVI